jgi:ABC-type branched-subunit amino acid transport system substrate-binding protein
MVQKHFECFTGRKDAIELFDMVWKWNADGGERWPLAPILSFIAPVGSGKSTLIEYLRETHRADQTLPNVRIDFSTPNTPKDLLFIMIEMRNRFVKYKDKDDRQFVFPRFDFAAAIALAALEESNAHRLSEGDLQQSLVSRSAVLDEWSESIGGIGNLVPVVPLILASVRATVQVEPLNRFLRWLREGPVWEWYREQAEALRLPKNSSIERIIRRLDEMSAPGESDRSRLIESILPEAMLADLRDAFTDKGKPRAWSEARRIVLLLDGFEVLLSEQNRIGVTLLKMFALSKSRLQGLNDPLLLVVASEEPIIEGKAEQAEAEMARGVETAETLRRRVERIYWQWHEQLPHERARLTFRHLYLPLTLTDFSVDETQRYLSCYGEQHNAPALQQSTLADNIHNLTKGHPLYLSLVAAAVSEAGAGIKDPGLVDLEHLPTEFGASIEDQMIEVFFKQLGEGERKQLIWSALPRTLDRGILREIFQLQRDVDVDERWQAIRRLTFVREVKGRLVLHPTVRALLLRKLPPSAEQERDYYRLHQRLLNYFSALVQKGEGGERARLEKVYHALALGDAQSAIDLGCYAQPHNLALWDPLLEVVAQAPSGPFTQETRLRLEQDAARALRRSEETFTVRDSVTAIVLYRWLLAAANGWEPSAYLFWKQLASAFTSLKTGDLQANLKNANNAYQQAVRSLEMIHTPATRKTDKLVSGNETIVLSGGGTADIVAGSTKNVAGSVGGPTESVAAVDGSTGAVGGKDQTTNSGASGSNVKPKKKKPKNKAGSKSGTQVMPGKPVISTIWLTLNNSIVRPSGFLAKRPLVRAVLFLALAIVVIAGASLFGAWFSIWRNAQPLPLPQIPSKQPYLFPPSAQTKQIGVIGVSGNSQSVGLSDGQIPFDIARPDHDVKIQAAQALRTNHIDDALQAWSHADPNDAESKIYAENQRILYTENLSCIYFVVATDLSGNTGDSVTVGRDNLQGAYLAQKKHNDNQANPKVCLLIANVGSDPIYAEKYVAPQIVSASPYWLIKAVMGWPKIDSSPHAVSVLEQAHIPIVSPNEYNDPSLLGDRGIPSNLFHVIPSSETEGAKAAMYAEQVLHPKTIAVFLDQSSPTSEGLVRGLQKQLLQNGTRSLVVDEYPGCNTDSCQPVNFQPLLQTALQARPDLIYFAGNAQDGNNFLATLNQALENDKSSVKPRVLGSDKLYQLVGYSALDRANFHDFDFTAFAYPDEPSVTDMKKDYALLFDQGDANPPVRAYGYSRPDNDAILSYDAMTSLMQGLLYIAAAGKQVFTAQDLLDALGSVSFQMLGTDKERTVRFDNKHQPTDGKVVVLRVDENGYIQINPDMGEL